MRGQDTLGNTVYVLKATVKRSLNIQSDRDSKLLRARTDWYSAFEGMKRVSRHDYQPVTLYVGKIRYNTVYMF